MMLEIILRVTFIPVQNKYPRSFYMSGFWQKMNIADQKVQVADEIKRDIYEYVVSSDVTDDA